MNIPYHNIIDILSSLLTPVIAIITSYIACQQYKLNRRSFRYEVYERKLSIFRTIENFLNNIVIFGETDVSSCHEFYNSTAESSFLLSKAIQKKREEIYNNAIKMVKLNSKLFPQDGSSDLPRGEKRDNIVNKEFEIKNWLIKQKEEVKELFQKEMSLK
jgi:hypothetical protein